MRYSDNNDAYSNDSNPLKGLIRTAIGLTPLGIGGLLMAKEIRSNASLTAAVPFGVGTSGNLLDVAGAVGGKLASRGARDRAADLARVEKLAADILEGDALTKLFSRVSEQNALLQSLLEAADDPTTGISSSLQSYKERLLDLSRASSDPDEMASVIKSMVKAINDQENVEAKLRWERNLREFRPIGAHLKPPLPPLEVTNPVDSKTYERFMSKDNPIDRRTKLAVAREAKLLAEELGTNGMSRIRIANRPVLGVNQFWAQVYSGAPGRSTFEALLPLHVTPVKGVVPFFSNEGMSTMRAAPRAFIDAPTLLSVISKGGKEEDIVREAFTPMPAYMRQLFASELRATEGGVKRLKSKSRHARLQAELMSDVVERIAYSGADAVTTEHLFRAAADAGNIAVVTNLPKTGMPYEDFMAMIGTRRPFEANSPGYGLLSMSQETGETIGRIGLYEDSPISYSRNIVPSNRAYFPVESRIEQVFGRKMAPVTGKATRMGRTRALHAGPMMIHKKGGTIQPLIEEAIEWAGGVTGATNKAVVLAVGLTREELMEVGADPKLANRNSVINRALSGQGVALTTTVPGSRGDRVRTFFSKPVIAGAEHGRLESELLQEIIRRAGSPGKEVAFTMDEIAKYSGFIGLGADELKFLREDPRASSFLLSYDVVQPSSGKKQYNIMGSYDKPQEVNKFFSQLFKGTGQHLEWKVWHQRAADLGMTPSRIKRLRIPQRHTLIAAGDPLKKAPGFFATTLMSGYALAGGSGKDDWRTKLVALAERQQYSMLPDMITSVDPKTSKIVTHGEHGLSRAFGAVLKAFELDIREGRLKADADTAGDIAMALAPTMMRARKGTKFSYLKGDNSIMEIEYDAMKGAVKEAFKDFGDFGERVIKGAVGEHEYGGLGGLAGTTSSVHTSLGDWGISRGSLEPRFLTNLQHKLRNMGLSPDETSDVIASIYMKKIGGISQLKAAKGLLNTLTSVTGQTDAIVGASEALSSLKTYTLSDLPDMIGEGKFAELVQSNPDGFLLDLTKGGTTVGHSAISAQAIEHLGGQGQIRFSGREVVDAMGDSLIKTTSGESQRVLDRYSAISTNLLKGLNASATQVADAPETAKEAIVKFREEIGELASDTIAGVVRGKTKSNLSLYAQMIDLDTDVTFNNPRNATVARKLFVKSKGRAAWMDATGFLAQLNDFMGNNPSKGAVVSAALAAQNFFEGGYRAMKRKGDIDAIVYGKTNPKTGRKGQGIKSVSQISMRHPLMGLGNVVATEVYRYVDNPLLRKMEDERIFKHVATMDRGKYAKFRNWHDVFKGMKGKELHGFFKSLIRSVEGVATDGGGSIYLPRAVHTVKFADKTNSVMNIDFGHAGAAIGDFDGDQWMSMILNRESGKTIRSTLSGTKVDDWLEADSAYKIKTEYYAEEAKKSLKKLHGDDIEFFSMERVRQSLLKESAAKTQVGRFDIRMNKLRLALLNLRMEGKADRALVDEAIAVLKVMEEHAVVKGKKMPRYMPIVEKLVQGLDMAFDHGQFSEFREAISSLIFKDSALLEEDVSIKTIETPFEFAKKGEGATISLRNVLDLFDRGIKEARVTRIADMPTANWIKKLVAENRPQDEIARAISMLNSGGTMESAMIYSAAGLTPTSAAPKVTSTIGTIGRALASLDNKFIGLGVAAVAASAIGLSMVGSEGYSPGYMTMPGEVIDPKVSASIGANTAFRDAQNITPAHGPNQYDTMNIPHNMGQTYMSTSGAYAVRGRIDSAQNIASFGNYLASLGNPYSGSLRVNDTRLPISDSYVRRLMGEY